ncbi:MAG TPA: nucleotidyltransferase domain-containing protein [Candidatus Binatia bacterium]|nr:nucleotidyltransferase domain-containing protein [Candidatus Binatia bacterium]
MAEQNVVLENIIPQNKVGGFVERLRAAAGANLESVILFGSAVAGDFHPGLSNINLLCVVRDGSFASLQALSGAIKWWDRQKQPPPLVMTRTEIERSTDLFTIELLDMKQHHRVLYGEDFVRNLTIPAHLHAIQVEYELREKLMLLRQHFLLAAGDDSRLWELLQRSVSSFATLFRHALVVLGENAPVSKRDSVLALARKVAFDAAGFLAVLEVREKKANRKNFDVTAISSQYLAAVEQAASAVDKMLDSTSTTSL